MLEKQTVLDRVEILEDGSLQIRRATYVTEDGKRIAGPIYHRTAYSPGANVATEHVRVQAIAQTVWTPDIVAAFRGRQRT